LSKVDQRLRCIVLWHVQLDELPRCQYSVNTGHRDQTHMQTLACRKIFVCQQIFELGPGADFVRPDTMSGGLFLWREDFCDLAVSPFADVVVLGLHTVYPALDLVPVILDEKDDTVQVLSDDGRKFLSCKLE